MGKGYSGKRLPRWAFESGSQVEQCSSEKVVYELLDPAGQQVLREEVAADGLSGHFEAEVSEVQLWSAEHPSLYQLVLSVYDAAGHLHGK